MARHNENQREERNDRRGRPRKLNDGPLHVEPRRKYALGDLVRYAGRPAAVAEVVPPQGRPSLPVPVFTIRASESYVLEVTGRDGEIRHVWPACHEIERPRGVA